MVLTLESILHSDGRRIDSRSAVSISRRQRSQNNLCLLAALNRPQEFEIHFRCALRNGCSLDELRDTLIQIAVYAGIPVAVEASRIARKVLAEGEADT